MKWKAVVRMSSILALGVTLFVTGTGCESSGGEGKDKDDNPGDAKNITGTSGLKVEVHNDVTNIYFDGDYIGTVAPGDTKIFKVPPGEHVVTITNAEEDNQKPDKIKIDFKSGFVHAIVVRWDDNSIL